MPMLHINPAESKPQRRKKAENKSKGESMRQIVIRCEECEAEMIPTIVKIGGKKTEIKYRCPNCKKWIAVKLICPKEEAEKQEEA